VFTAQKVPDAADRTVSANNMCIDEQTFVRYEKAFRSSGSFIRAQIVEHDYRRQATGMPMAGNNAIETIKYPVRVCRDLLSDSECSWILSRFQTMYAR